MKLERKDIILHVLAVGLAAAALWRIPQLTVNQTVSAYNWEYVSMSAAMCIALGVALVHQIRSGTDRDTVLLTFGLLSLEMTPLFRIGFWAFGGLLAPDGTLLSCSLLGPPGAREGVTAAGAVEWLSAHGGAVKCGFKPIPYASWVWDYRAYLLGPVQLSTIGSALALRAALKDRIGRSWWALPTIVSAGALLAGSL